MKNARISRIALITVFCCLSLTLTYAVSTIDPETTEEVARMDILGFIIALIGFVFLLYPVLRSGGLVMCVLGLILGITSRKRTKKHLYRKYSIIIGVSGVVLIGIAQLLMYLIG